jgi:hypothetical protein
MVTKRPPRIEEGGVDDGTACRTDSRREAKEKTSSEDREHKEKETSD